ALKHPRFPNLAGEIAGLAKGPHQRPGAVAVHQRHVAPGHESIAHFEDHGIEIPRGECGPALQVRLIQMIAGNTLGWPFHLDRRDTQFAQLFENRLERVRGHEFLRHYSMVSVGSARRKCSSMSLGEGAGRGGVFEMTHGDTMTACCSKIWRTGRIRGKCWIFSCRTGPIPGYLFLFTAEAGGAGTRANTGRWGSC